MAPHTLFDSFLAPTVEPSSPHVCGDNVFACRVADAGRVVQEIYRGSDSFFRFRYFAWVAWRDAGNEVRDHTWYELAPDQGLITDEYATICEMAEQHATSKGLVFSDWSMK